MGQLKPGQALVDGPEELVVADTDAGYAIERAQNLLVGLVAQGAQKHRTVEFSLSVDTNVQDVLVIVFEFDPASPVRDNLAQVVTLRRHALEENAGRAVELGDNHAFGAVDDERAVVRHERNLAEEDFLLLDVADALGAGLRILGVDGQPDRDFQRSGVGHPALLALLLVVFQLQAHGVAALVAKCDDVPVEGAAMLAQHVSGVERVRADGCAALAAGGPQVVETFEIAALAFPVADGIIHELQLAHAAEIGNGKDGTENRLQADVVALVGEQVHLQKPLVGLLLYLNQIRDRDGGLDFGEINSLGGGAVLLNIHSLLLRAGQAKTRQRVEKTKNKTTSPADGKSADS
jgi:hypothetical protein